ncbi:BREX-1 system adenine-specific DNA-methyltransferase PglX [Desulfoplanes sp. PS50]
MDNEMTANTYISADTKKKRAEDYFFRASAEDFKKIPGIPITYWLSLKALSIFSEGSQLSDVCTIREGINTGDNNRFLKIWYEVNYSKISIPPLTDYGKKWFPHRKGGKFRKWYGNQEYILLWEKKGKDIHQHHNLPITYNGAPLRGKAFFFKKCLSWSRVSSGKFAMRFYPDGMAYDSTSPSIFISKDDLFFLLGFLNSRVVTYFMHSISPTLDYRLTSLGRMPINYSRFFGKKENIKDVVKTTLELATFDWDSYETSWDFTTSSLQPANHKCNSIPTTYATLRRHWRSITLQTQHLEEENNRIFIEAYGLQDELTPDVPRHEITLTCNPHYRYGPGKTQEEYDALLLTDTMKELISYAIGCMMGRYSLDEPGLIYAHSGNKDFDSTRYTTFPADDDGIVPVMDMNWFEDDASKRFEEFLKLAWNEETLEENLKFVADALSPKRGEEPRETIRRFISTSFFKDHHLKIYKKRPIYWLFSSGKNKAFECLVYLHRYNENTLSRMRAMYVTPLQGKYATLIQYLQEEKEKASSASASKKFQKQLTTMLKKQEELRSFDELLRHYADQRITLDLDDGVKVNYGKFGKLLAEVKDVTGKQAE